VVKTDVVCLEVVVAAVVGLLVVLWPVVDLLVVLWPVVGLLLVWAVVFGVTVVCDCVELIAVVPSGDNFVKLANESLGSEPKVVQVPNFVGVAGPEQEELEYQLITPLLFGTCHEVS